jgi:class 3 adenylate cyclase
MPQHLPWTNGEEAKIEQAMIDNLELEQIHSLFPDRNPRAVREKAGRTKQSMDRGDWLWTRAENREVFRLRGGPSGKLHYAHVQLPADRRQEQEAFETEMLLSQQDVVPGKQYPNWTSAENANMEQAIIDGLIRDNLRSMFPNKSITAIDKKRAKTAKAMDEGRWKWAMPVNREIYLSRGQAVSGPSGTYHWSDAEKAKLEQAIMDGLDPSEMKPMFPNRTRQAVRGKICVVKLAMDQGKWNWANEQNHELFESRGRTTNLRRDRFPKKQDVGKNDYMEEDYEEDDYEEDDDQAGDDETFAAYQPDENMSGMPGIFDYTAYLQHDALSDIQEASQGPTHNQQNAAALSLETFNYRDEPMNDLPDVVEAVVSQLDGDVLDPLLFSQLEEYNQQEGNMLDPLLFSQDEEHHQQEGNMLDPLLFSQDEEHHQQTPITPDFQEPPNEKVCIVFTDIINSTEMWEQDEQAMVIALVAHNGILQDQMGTFGGYEIKTLGDGFHIAFETAESALNFCLVTQRLISQLAWPESIFGLNRHREAMAGDYMGSDRGLTVRMGIHFGTPSFTMTNPVTGRKDFFGIMVNIASRIQGLAKGDQIAVSDDFIRQLHREQRGDQIADALGPLSHELRTEIMERLPGTQFFNFESIGLRKLKGIKNPEHVSLIKLIRPTPTPLDTELSQMLIQEVEDAEDQTVGPADFPSALANGANNQDN